MNRLARTYLLTPGPTEVPPSVLNALGKTTMHHRLPAFSKIFKSVSEDLKYLFQTDNGVITLSSSGTGAMEAAVANLLSTGDKALVVRAGKFGERWTEIAEAYGVKVENIDVEWGYAVKPEQIAEALDKTPEIKAVFVTLCETSTGVQIDLKQIGAIVGKTPSALVCDAVSAIGAVELRMDEWQVDAVVAGSQKAMMLPPGIGFIALSDKAWRLAEKSNLPKYYFDLIKAKKNLENDTTPYTTPVNMIYALRESLRLIREMSLEKIWTRNALLAKATRAGIIAMGMEVYPKAICDALTVIKLPEEIDGAKLVKNLRDVHGVTLAGGQAQLKGKIARIAHMGYTDKPDVLMALSMLEIALNEHGFEVELGTGVRAASQVFLAE